MKVHRPSLRSRDGVLYLLIEHDGTNFLRRTPWLRLDVDADAGDMQISAACGRAIETFRREQEEKALPVATGTLKTYRRQALQEIDDLGLSVKVTEQRGRHLDALVSWLDDRGLAVEEDHLLTYLQTIPIESRNRRDGETAARLLLLIAKRQELLIPKGQKWRRPPPKRTEPLDGNKVIETILRLAESEPEIGWIRAMVALTGCRGAMAMSCELMWHPVPVEIGSYIRCRDNKRGRDRAANLCPSWKELLLALPAGFIENPPDKLREVAMPWDRKPTAEQQRAAEKRMVYLSNKLRNSKGFTPEERALVDLRQLRHHRAHALLDSPLNVLRICELLSTSPDMLAKVYSDHHRFRAGEDVRQLFG